MPNDTPRNSESPRAGAALAAACLTAALVLTGIPATAGEPRDAEISTGPGPYTIGPGIGTGPYDTAFGFFSGTGSINVCTLVDIPDLGGLSYRINLQNYRIGLTSPNGEATDASDIFGLSLRWDAGGLPGEKLGFIQYDDFIIPSSYPEPTVVSQDIEGAEGTLEGTESRDIHVCLESWTTRIHFGARLKADAKITTSGDDGQTWNTFQGLTTDWEIKLEVGFARPDSQTYIGPYASIDGVNSTFEDRRNVRYVSPNFAGFTMSSTWYPRNDQVGDPPPTDLEFDANVQYRWSSGIEGVGWSFGTITTSGEANSEGAQTAMVRSGAPLMFESVITSTLSDGRVFGQWYPAFTEADGIGAGERALYHTTHDPSRYRVNLWVVALEDGTTVSVTPVEPIDTARAAAHTVTLSRGENFQINDVHGSFGLGSLANFMLELDVQSGSAIGVASVLDGTALNPGTSDPTTVLAAEPSTTVTLLEVGPVQGINEFSGSALVTNHSPTTAQVTADFYARGAPGIAATTSFTIPAGDTLGFDDVVGDLLGLANTVGTLVLRTTNGTQVSAIGREFAVFRDTQGSVNGTAGQLMPGLTPDDLLVPGSTYEFLGLTQRQDQGGNERSHLSVYNPGSSDVTVTLTLLDDQGVEEGTIQRTVRAGELLRLNNVPDQISSAQDGGLKSLVLTTTGNVHALVFTVNTTGDPVTRPPFVR